MKIGPVGAGEFLPQKSQGTGAKPEAPATPADVVELGGSAQNVSGGTKPTYARSDVPSVTSAGTQNLETRMTPDARASKLAAIEKRVGEGAYNARDIIERVADRLLEKWGLVARNPEVPTE